MWIGGDSGATVTLSGNNAVTYGDQYAVIIGHGTTGAAGTVRITTPNSLNAATQRTDVYSGTLDLNGQANVRSTQIRLLSGAPASC